MDPKATYIVTDQGPATGIGIYAEALCKLLRSSLSELSLVSLCYSPVEELPGWQRLPGSLVTKTWTQVPAVLRHNYRLLRENVSPESIVHFCGTSFASVPEFPHAIVTVHDFYPRIPSFRDARDPVMLARDSSALWQFITIPRQVRTALRVVPSKYVQQCLASRCSLSSTAIHHWIDATRFHPREMRHAREVLGLPSEERLVLNVSVGTSNKNHAALARVADHLRKGYWLVKVGDRLPVSSKVLHLPRLSHDLYPLLYNACDMYLQTSTQEGFGWPLIEAIGSELPVVSLRTEVALEVLGPAGTYVSRSAPVDEWVAAIERLSCPEVHDDSVAEERRRLSHFEPERARKEYLAVYERAFGH